MPTDKNKKTDIEFNDPISIKDTDWVTDLFILPGNKLDDIILKSSMSWSADDKIFSNSLGDRLAINGTTMFCPYADPMYTGKLDNNEELKSVTDTVNNKGQGGYWSTAYDDNKQLLYLEFGVPTFKSVFSFWSRAVNSRKSIITTYGRSPFFYDVGTTVGTIFTAIVFSVPFIVINLLKLTKNLFFASDNNFYGFKPTIHDYWDTTYKIVTQMGIEMGIIYPELTNSNNKNPLNVKLNLKSNILKQISASTNNIIDENGVIDIYKIASGPQKLMNEMISAESGKLNNYDTKDYLKFLNDNNVKSTGTTLAEFKKKLLKNNKEYGKKPTSDKNNPPKSQTEKIPNTDSKDYINKTLPGEKDKDKDDGFWDYFKAVYDDGGRYLILNVNYVGKTTNSFSNTFKDIPIKSAFNGMGNKMRDVRFSLSDGNLLGSVTKAVTDGLLDMAKGFISGATMGFSDVISGLLDGGQLDFPIMWDNSSIQLDTRTYRIELGGYHNDPYTLLTRDYLTIACLLSAVIPRAIGNSSYTSPFLCKANVRGQTPIELGMLSTLTIEGGTSSLATDDHGRALGYVLTFKITDFSPMVASAVEDSILSTLTFSADNNTGLSKFIRGMSGRDVYNDKYILPNVKRKWALAKANVSKLSSSAYWGMMFGDTADHILPFKLGMNTSVIGQV